MTTFEHEFKAAMIDNVISAAEGRQVMAQVNFKSGNRVSGMLSRREGVYFLDVAAQTQDNQGAMKPAIAHHAFWPSDVEAVVVLKEIEQSRIIS